MQPPIPLGPSPSLPLPAAPFVVDLMQGALGMCIPSGTVAAGAVNFSGPGVVFNAIEAGRQYPVPTAKTFRTLVFVTNGPQPAGQALTVRIRKNGLDTNLTLIVPGGAPAGTFIVQNVPVDFARGDLLSLGATQDAGASPSATILGWSCS